MRSNAHWQALAAPDPEGRAPSPDYPDLACGLHRVHTFQLPNRSGTPRHVILWTEKIIQRFLKQLVVAIFGANPRQSRVEHLENRIPVPSRHLRKHCRSSKTGSR